MFKNKIEYFSFVLFYFIFIRFPKVRKVMSDKLYLFLLSSGEEYYGEERCEKGIELLTSIDWLDVN